MSKTSAAINTIARWLWLLGWLWLIPAGIFWSIRTLIPKWNITLTWQTFLAFWFLVIIGWMTVGAVCHAKHSNDEFEADDIASSE